MTMKHLAHAAIAATLAAAAPGAHAQPWRGEPLEAAAPFEGLATRAKAAMNADPSTALAHARDALAVARRARLADQAIQEATARWLMGEALIRLNRPGEAGPLVEHALAAVAPAQPGSELHGRLLMTRASVLADRGRTAAAHEGFRAAYRVFLALEDRRGQAMALQNIGSIHQDAGDYARVLDSYEAAARLYPDDPTLLVAAHNNRANALKALGRYAEAEAAFREALQVSRTLASPVLEARIRTNMAAAEVLAGDFAAAEANIAEGLRITERDPAAAEWRAFLFGVAAQAALKQGDLQRASALLDRTFEGVDPQRSHMAYRDFHRTASEVYGQLRDGRRAQIHRVALRRLDGQGSQLASR